MYDKYFKEMFTVALVIFIVEVLALIVIYLMKL